MALGGGNFITHNKILPGSYINFVSAKRASSMLSDRGIAAMGLELDWCIEGQVFEVTNEDFQRYSLKKFGYEYNHPKLKGLRDLFKNIQKGYFYKLNTGVKATNKFANAKYGGRRGNDLKIVIETNVDDSTKFDVSTLVDNKKVDLQIVKTSSELKSNDWVDFVPDVTLELTAATPLTGGTNGSDITGENYQAFLNKIESYNFHALGCLATNEEIKNLLIAFTKRMRNEIGVKFQTVLYKNNSYDFEGIISVENSVKDVDETGNDSSLVYWTTGISAGCSINKSNTNKKYDGEFTVDTDYTQLELEEALLSGKFIFHNVDGEVRVLEDINTFTSFTEEKNSDFSSNQTIRVLDQIANDIAVLFNTKFLGKVQNNDSGRVSFWNEVVKHHQEMQKIQAIENFNADDVKVLQGQDKKTVIVNDAAQVINCMTKLYMTVEVR